MALRGDTKKKLTFGITMTVLFLFVFSASTLLEVFSTFAPFWDFPIGSFANTYEGIPFGFFLLGAVIMVTSLFLSDFLNNQLRIGE